ncbi:cytochrome P450 family protein [Prescottella agglutinans]|uniref:cytochrome P450 family protein n=1 Tax=Prescottella agglutinans TaxID=1644129 RepID=UPI003D96003B
MSTHVEFGAEFFEDPWSAYANLRVDGAVHRFSSGNGLTGWLVTDYALARDALTDTRLIKTKEAMAGVDVRVQPKGFRARARRQLRQLTAPWMVNHLLAAEPPHHTRLRKVLQPHFSPKALSALDGPIREYARDLTDQLHGRKSFDVVADYALPLPVTVISHILGVPIDKRDRVAEISKVLSDVVVATPQQLRSAGLAMARLLLPLVRERTRRPQDDLLSDLAIARAEGRMTLQEIVATVALLLVAGHETTTNLIGNTIHTFLTQPAVAAAWQPRSEATIEPFIEESLRYEPPLQSTTLRVAAENMTLAGQHITEGDLVLVSLASANRDPNRFPHPDEFNPERGARGHIAFGHGLHHCIGAPLARLEGRIAVTGLFQQFPHMQIDPDAHIHWRPSVNFRGLQALPVQSGGSR